MLKNVYEGLNARPKVYLSKEYFCEMYPTCVSSKLCEFIYQPVTLRSEKALVCQKIKIAWRWWWWIWSSTTSASGPCSSAVLLSTPHCHIFWSPVFVNVYHEAFEKYKNNIKKGTGQDRVWSEIYFKIVMIFCGNIIQERCKI